MERGQSPPHGQVGYRGAVVPQLTNTYSTNGSKQSRHPQQVEYDRDTAAVSLPLSVGNMFPISAASESATPAATSTTNAVILPEIRFANLEQKVAEMRHTIEQLQHHDYEAHNAHHNDTPQHSGKDRSAFDSAALLQPTLQDAISTPLLDTGLEHQPLITPPRTQDGLLGRLYSKRAPSLGTTPVPPSQQRLELSRRLRAQMDGLRKDIRVLKSTVHCSDVQRYYESSSREDSENGPPITADEIGIATPIPVFPFQVAGTVLRWHSGQPTEFSPPHHQSRPNGHPPGTLDPRTGSSADSLSNHSQTSQADREQAAQLWLSHAPHLESTSTMVQRFLSGAYDKKIPAILERAALREAQRVNQEHTKGNKDGPQVESSRAAVECVPGCATPGTQPSSTRRNQSAYRDVAVSHADRQRVADLYLDFVRNTRPEGDLGTSAVVGGVLSRHHDGAIPGVLQRAEDLDARKAQESHDREYAEQLQRQTDGESTGLDDTLDEDARELMGRYYSLQGKGKEKVVEDFGERNDNDEASRRLEQTKQKRGVGSALYEAMEVDPTTGTSSAATASARDVEIESQKLAEIVREQQSQIESLQAQLARAQATIQSQPNTLGVFANNATQEVDQSFQEPLVRETHSHSPKVSHTAITGIATSGSDTFAERKVATKDAAEDCTDGRGSPMYCDENEKLSSSPMA